MRDVIVQILGSYSPVLDSNNEPVSGLAGVDWPYIFGGVFLIVCLWAVSRFAIRLFG